MRGGAQRPVIGHRRRRRVTVPPAGARWPGAGAAPGAGALEHVRPAPAGVADRRDRRPDRRHVAVGAAAATHRLRPASGRLPAWRRPVWGARRARLPHPLDGGEPHGARRQRLQHQGHVATAGRLHGAGDPGCAGAADPGAGDAPRQPGGQAARGAHAAGGGADPGRRRRDEVLGGRPRLRLRPGAGGTGRRASPTRSMPRWCRAI